MCGVDRFRGLTVPGAAAINMTVPEVYSVPGGISLMQSPTGLAVVFMSLGAFGLLSPPGERSMACAVEGLAGFAVALLLWFYAIDEVFYVGLGFARSCALLSYLPLALAVVSFVLMGLQLVGPRFSRLVLGSLIGFVIGFELYIVVGYRTDTEPLIAHSSLGPQPSVDPMAGSLGLDIAYFCWVGICALIGGALAVASPGMPNEPCAKVLRALVVALGGGLAVCVAIDTLLHRHGGLPVLDPSRANEARGGLWAWLYVALSTALAIISALLREREAKREFGRKWHGGAGRSSGFTYGDGDQGLLHSFDGDISSGGFSTEYRSW